MRPSFGLDKHSVLSFHGVIPVVIMLYLAFCFSPDTMQKEMEVSSRKNV